MCLRVFEFKEAGDILFDGEHGYLPYEPVILDFDMPGEQEEEGDVQPVVVPDHDDDETVVLDAADGGDVPHAAERKVERGRDQAANGGPLDNEKLLER